MPRFFFRLSNGGTLHDGEGEDLRDDNAARDVAIEVLAETLVSRRQHLNEGEAYEVMVTDADDRQVYSITAQGRRFDG
ncbi:MAG: hypothetical protein V4701_01875 [Pseudomonadota bacterium]